MITVNLSIKLYDITQLPQAGSWAATHVTEELLRAPFRGGNTYLLTAPVIQGHARNYPLFTLDWEIVK